MPEPENYQFDLYQEHPNVDINTMRLAIVQAIADLQQSAAGIDDSYFLTDLLFTLLDTALGALEEVNTRLTALEALATNLQGGLP